MNKDLVVIYTDGSCLKNPGGPGGYAAILCLGTTVLEIWGGEKESTNNRMELTAAIKALEQLKKPCKVELNIDSRYVMDAFKKGWLKAWKAKGWKTAGKNPVKNRELWEALDKAASDHEIVWKHVYGHTGQPENERCDVLAKHAAVQASKTGDFFQRGDYRQKVNKSL